MLFCHGLLNKEPMSFPHAMIEIGAALVNTLMKMMLKCIARI